MFLYDENTGWVSTNGQLYKTDGSSSFILIYKSSKDITSINEVSKLVVDFLKFAADIFKSTDGGFTFTLLKKLPSNYFIDHHFVSNTTGYASCANCIYKTTEGGVTWYKEVVLANTELVE